MAVTRALEADSLQDRYEIGAAIGRILDKYWDESGKWYKSDVIRRMPEEVQALIDKLGAKYDMTREELRACHRLYRAWPPGRFKYLTSLRRADGNVLFPFRVLQKLQATELADDRRELEQRLIRTQMDAEDFIALLRRKKRGLKHAAPRRVHDPRTAFRRFVKAADNVIARFALIDRGVELLTESDDLALRTRYVAILVRDRLNQLLRESAAGVTQVEKWTR